MQKVTECLILSERSYCVFAPQGFVIKCFLIFIVDEVKNFAANVFLKLVVSHVLGVMHHWLVTYWDPCKKGGVHILKSLEVLKRQKVSIISSSMGIVKFRDKSFVLDLKLLFTIVDCFSGVKLVCFIGFLKSSYLVLFNFSLCMMLT